MSQAKWLVAAVVPGVERQPLKRLDADEAALVASGSSASAPLGSTE
jgi:hypothetical protein